eukprot:284103-Alexandrium_andersonii.AAC.1
MRRTTPRRRARRGTSSARIAKPRGACCSTKRSRSAQSRGMARGSRCAEGAGQAAPSRLPRRWRR